VAGPGELSLASRCKGQSSSLCRPGFLLITIVFMAFSLLRSHLHERYQRLEMEFIGFTTVAKAYKLHF